jgi:endonuclease/exonuclease/phosphatase family metal-dependent hydrolase
VALAGVLYPLSLAAITAALRLVGERWPVTAVALYAPRALFGLPLPFLLAALIVLGHPRLAVLQIVSGLVLLFPLMGFVLPHGIPAKRGSLRVLSYNVNSCHGGADKIAEEIDRFSPDIVLLQECDTDRMAPPMRARYPVVDTSTQFLVASRYPIAASDDPDRLLYGGHHRSPRFVRRVIETPLGSIAFYSIHPISPREALVAVRHGLPRELRAGHFPGDLGAPVLPENFGLRELQVRTISEEASRESVPVVIAGDTNLPGGSVVFDRYLSRYVDGFNAVGRGFGYTFPNGAHPSWMRIDRILTASPLRFTSFFVGDSPASDHRCVVADFERNAP